MRKVLLVSCIVMLAVAGCQPEAPPDPATPHPGSLLNPLHPPPRARLQKDAGAPGLTELR